MEAPLNYMHTHIRKIIAVLSVSLIVFFLITGYVFLQHQQTTTTTQSHTTHTNQYATTSTQAAQYSDATSIGSNITVQSVSLTGDAPQGLAVDPKTGYVYTGNEGSVVALNCTNGKDAGAKTTLPPLQNGQTNGSPQGQSSSGTLPPPQNSGTLAPLDSSGHPQMIQSATPVSGANTMSIIDPATNKELKRVNTDGSPIWPFVDDDRGVVYLATSSGYLDIFSLGSGNKLAALNVGGTPHDVGLDSSTGILIVSNTYDTSGKYYTVIDANSRTIITHHQVSQEPHGIVIDEPNHIAYMISVSDGTLNIIDTKTGDLQTTYTTGAKTYRGTNLMALSPSEHKLFIVEGSSSVKGVMIFNLDTHQITDTITTKEIPWGLAIDETTHLLYVPFPDLSQMAVINTNNNILLGYIPIGSCPFAIRLDVSRGLGFSSNMVGNSISVFKLSDIATNLH